MMQHVNALFRAFLRFRSTLFIATGVLLIWRWVMALSIFAHWIGVFGKIQLFLCYANNGRIIMLRVKRCIFLSCLSHLPRNDRSAKSLLRFWSKVYFIIKLQLGVVSQRTPLFGAAPSWWGDEQKPLRDGDGENVHTDVEINGFVLNICLVFFIGREAWMVSVW